MVYLVPSGKRTEGDTPSIDMQLTINEVISPPMVTSPPIVIPPLTIRPRVNHPIVPHPLVVHPTMAIKTIVDDPPVLVDDSDDEDEDESDEDDSDEDDSEDSDDEGEGSPQIVIPIPRDRYLKVKPLPGHKIIKWTYELVKAYVESTGEKLISPTYRRMNEKLEYRCQICDGNYHCVFDAFYRQHIRHKDCMGNKKHTIEEVRDVVTKNGDILLSTVYVNNKTKLDIQCGNCVSHYSMTYAKYQGKYRSKERLGPICKHCCYTRFGDERRLDIEVVRQYIADRGERLISTVYVRHLKKIKIECALCKAIYEVTYNSYRRGTRCSDCNMSHGERTIKLYLTKKGISFERNKSFNGCRDKRRLRFDFYLPGLHILIEFDGLQHFSPVQMFGKEAGLIDCQRHDRIKTNYAVDNRIKLIRIDYKFLNQIDTLLDAYLAGPEMLCLSDPAMYTYLNV